jgi:hypothetical protein
MVFWDANHNVITSAGGVALPENNNFDPTSGRRAAQAVAGFLAPSNARYASGRVVWNKYNGVMTSMHVRQCKLERGRYPSAYSSEASAIQNFSAYSTLSSNYADYKVAVEARFQGSTSRYEEINRVLSEANGSVAQRASNLEATTGSLSSSINQTSNIANVAYERTSGARWALTARSNTGRAQLAVYSYDNNGNPQSGVDIVGDLSIHGNVMIEGTLTTGKLASNAAQSVQWAKTSGQQVLTYNQWTRIVQLGFNKTNTESSIDLYANIRMRSNDDITGQFRLINLNDGAVQDIWPVWMQGANSLFQVPVSLNWIATGWGAGGYTLAIDYLSSENDQQTFSEAGSIIKIHEIKR